MLMSKMTEEQRYKLERVLILVRDSLEQYQNTDNKIISVWLSVAGDYCKEVADEIF